MQSPCEVFSRSDDAVIRVYNRGGDPVQTREDELNLTGEISSTRFRSVHDETLSLAAMAPQQSRWFVPDQGFYASG